MYAVFEIGGKQYKVKEGDVIDVELLPYDVGEEVETDKVLLVRNGDIKIGTPYVEGAKIKFKVLEHGKGEKIIVFKYKPKVRYRRKKGHRQPYTRILIEEIRG